GSRPDPADDAILVADWTPLPDHEAFAGVLNGGILGTLLGCPANWTVACNLMRARGAARPPTTVTLEFAIRMRRPTPSDAPIHLRAHVVESGDDRATVAGRISVRGTL